MELSKEGLDELCEALSQAISDARGIGVHEVKVDDAYFAKGVEAGLRCALSLVLADGPHRYYVTTLGFGVQSPEAEVLHAKLARERRLNNGRRLNSPRQQGAVPGEGSDLPGDDPGVY